MSITSMIVGYAIYAIIMALLFYSSMGGRARSNDDKFDDDEHGRGSEGAV